MATDFTVIQAVRQRFGDEIADLGEASVEQSAPFVGKSKDFRFSCPNIARGEAAVLEFQSLGVSARNVLQINGVNVASGITPGPMGAKAQGKAAPLWNAHVLLVAANVLKEENVLHIESVSIPFAHEQTLDNFIVDNIVVFFKTRPGAVGGSGIGPS
jgi:hypothetical protein